MECEQTMTDHANIVREALRSARGIDSARSLLGALAALDALVAERDEAREKNAKLSALIVEQEAEYRFRKKAAEAEVARLREALTVYAGRTNDYEVARAALGEDA